MRHSDERLDARQLEGTDIHGICGHAVEAGVSSFDGQLLADRPRIRDALKRREEEIDSYEKPMKFFQESANEIEKILEPMAMWDSGSRY